ncbi:AP-3 complex subunit mu-1 [Trichoplax sp. H2]|uniref:MHD domain-containing protein n=1 Tax=Trichoplax adhaerens TaxID=10228 RepID=B3RNL1_TRIAD|nr:hypothetical protein TRIADDRAFT_21237 [Trichoplax adhaerens]EDV27475.1 hypothetical protein TRIADDRAFT_21237 [Trichoplax adhaerens]RDD38665.1 AP-3 complex subunit mu-1 [Trichoplax sp. H2]|eukprot:XP_002109309.1 hypothetical protein TRIADDRAFT_21237 [Trichoplax adhaerens]
MIHSLFILNKNCEVFFEKHWKSVVSRSVCDHFLEALNQASSPDDVPTAIGAPRHILINIYRNKLFFIAVVQGEVPPLFVIEFLHRVVDTITDYFSSCTELTIKDNSVVVFEILEEMLDNGYPLATELNVLKELIKPPSIVRNVMNTVTGSTNVGGQLPTGQLSNVPWRKVGVKYTNNEVYFDFVEELDVIIDKTGTTVFAEVNGAIKCQCKLSGMPDLVMTFTNPRMFDDLSFHPCIRYRRWENERVVSFVPPDGNFQLLSYRLGTNSVVAIPVYVKPTISFQGSSGRFEITVGPKQTMGKVVENVAISMTVPKVVSNVVLSNNPEGNFTYDPVSKTMRWEIGKVMHQKISTIRGSMPLQSGASAPDSNPTILVEFKVNQLAISNIKVNRLDIYGEKYKAFKGVKYITKAGKFQVRT